jgi:outer membrane protein assembly factor BamB
MRAMFVMHDRWPAWGRRLVAFARVPPASSPAPPSPTPTLTARAATLIVSNPLFPSFLCGVDVQTHQKRWCDTQAGKEVADANTVYVAYGSRNGVIAAHDRLTYQTLWQQSIPYQCETANPIMLPLVQGLLILVNNPCALLTSAFQAETGTSAWQTNSALFATRAGTGYGLASFNGGAALDAVSLSNGSVLWQLALP